MPRASSPFASSSSTADAEDYYYYPTTTTSMTGVTAAAAGGTRTTSPLHFLYPTMMMLHHHDRACSGSAASASGHQHDRLHSHSHHHSHHSHHRSHSHHRDTHHHCTKDTKDTIAMPHAHALSSPHHSSHGSKRDSRLADISRLLDPAYRPSSSTYATHAHACGSGTSTAYVDTHGDLHDPDFRHFPSAADRERFALARTRTGGASPTKGGSRDRAAYRPHWERGDELALEDEEDEMMRSEDDHQLDADSAYFLSHPRYTSRRSSGGAGAGASHHFRIHTSPSSYSYSYAPSTGTASSGYSPTYSVTSTLPTSVDSGETVFSAEASPFDSLEKEKEKEGKEKERRGLLKRRRCSKGEKERRASIDLAPMSEKTNEEADQAPVQEQREQEEKEQGRRQSQEERDHARANNADEEEEEEDDELLAGRGETGVPTCGESIRRQWQALALRFRFGVFRAQRRVRRRVHSLL